jgi:hypothetical protein
VKRSATDFQRVAGHLMLDLAIRLTFATIRIASSIISPPMNVSLLFCHQSEVDTEAQMRKLLAGVSEFDSQRVLKDVIELREASTRECSENNCR